MVKAENRRLLDLHGKAMEHFDSGDWKMLGLMTDHPEVVDGHGRLLRSLSFGDDDYSACALDVLQKLVRLNEDALDIMDDYTAKKYPPDGEFISSTPARDRTITFAPSVFQVPASAVVESGLISVMMPFGAAFSSVYESIKLSAADSGLQCTRADDVWEHATIIQDIFSLIFRSRIVVVFTGKNPNVMYETGIAHTLGKHVVPISQSLDDVPFDMRHHRVLKYLPNAQGMADLRLSLGHRLRSL